MTELDQELLKWALEKNYEPRPQKADYRLNGGPRPLRVSRGLSALWAASQKLATRRISPMLGLSS
jgi:hypothetical protein